MREYQVILVHPTKSEILMQKVGETWSLPNWQTEEQHFSQETRYLIHQIKEIFGLDTVVLRYIGHYKPPQNESINHEIFLYELEVQSEASLLPENITWLNRQQFSRLSFLYPEQQLYLREWFAKLEKINETKPAINSRAWAQRGWYKEANAWLIKQLTEKFPEISPESIVIDQVRNWERSTILHAEITDRAHFAKPLNFYLKAVPAIFGHEPYLAQVLGKEWRENFPQNIGLDPERHWFIMAEFAGKPLANITDFSSWEETVRKFAELQYASTNRLNELKKIGCPDRSLSILAQQIEPFFAGLERYSQNLWLSLKSEEIEQLRNLIPELQRSCTQLASFKLPQALEHGDFWPGNVYVNDETCLFFDWSDASLAHPFFSLTLFVDLNMIVATEVKESLGKIPEPRKHLQEIYLESWSSYGSPEFLDEAFRLAEKLAPLHHAQTYHFYILPNLKEQWEMESMVVYYLQMLLKNFGL